MGKRIIISENEKSHIKRQYGLINEIDMETILLGGGGLYFIYKFIKDFIGIGLFNMVLKNPKQVDKFIKSLEDKIEKEYKKSLGPEFSEYYGDDFKKITNKFSEELKRKVNNGEFVNLWQFFDESFKMRRDVKDDQIDVLMKDVKKDYNQLRQDMRNSGLPDDQINTIEDIADDAFNTINKYHRRR